MGMRSLTLCFPLLSLLLLLTGAACAQQAVTSAATPAVAQSEPS